MRRGSLSARVWGGSRHAVWVLVALTACASTGLAFDWPTRNTKAYQLDDVPRALQQGQVLPCERGEVELVTYRGEVVRYHKPVRIHPAFRPQLTKFEALVDEVGREHFGRAPRRVVHLGAFACRPMRRHAHWMSEHALGNAIDVAGFDFGPLPRTEHASHPDLDKALRRPFQVRIEKHWDAKGKLAPQAAFLQALAQRIIASPEVFHVILGPDWPGHHNHFHLDHAPYRMVKIGDQRSVFWRW